MNLASSFGVNNIQQTSEQQQRCNSLPGSLQACVGSFLNERYTNKSATPSTVAASTNSTNTTSSTPTSIISVTNSTMQQPTTTTTLTSVTTSTTTASTITTNAGDTSHHTNISNNSNVTQTLKQLLTQYMSQTSHNSNNTNESPSPLSSPKNHDLLRSHNTPSTPNSSSSSSSGVAAASQFTRGTRINTSSYTPHRSGLASTSTAIYLKKTSSIATPPYDSTLLPTPPVTPLTPSATQLLAQTMLSSTPNTTYRTEITILPSNYTSYSTNSNVNK